MTRRCAIHSRGDARRAGQLFLDADLAILAADEARLLPYDRGIAREWGQNPDAPSDAFRNGRRQALEHDPLFLSVGFAPLAAPARANLRFLIQRYSCAAGSKHPRDRK